VSRPTFGRILSEARRIVAEVLVMGKVLRIEGGDLRCRLTGGEGAGVVGADHFERRCSACQDLIEQVHREADP